MTDELNIEEQIAINNARTPGTWRRDEKNFDFVNANGDGAICSAGYDAFWCNESDESFIIAASANYGVLLAMVQRQELLIRNLDGLLKWYEKRYPQPSPLLTDLE